MEALVTDTHDRAALAGVRGLGRAGNRAIALAPQRAAGGLWSRYASARALGPDALTDPHGFALRVDALLEEHGEPIVYPGREESIDALLGAGNETIAHRCLPWSSLEALDAVRDKRRLPALAAAGGLAAPRTLFEGALAEARALSFDFPLVLKAALPESAFKHPRLIGSDAELESVRSEHGGAEQVLAQQRLPGGLMAVALILDNDGAVAARFQQRTALTWPPQMGVSAIAISVAPNEELVESVAQMLRSVGYAGLAQVQMIDSPEGPVVIDVNPRFYGSLPLALASGLNLPAIWHATVTGNGPSSPPGYRTGVLFQWLAARLFARARGHQMSRGPGGNGRAGAVWARDDPLASAASLAATVGDSLVKRLPSLRRR